MEKLKKIIIGNWKMRLNLDESIHLAEKLKKIIKPEVEMVVCPSFVYLSKIAEVLKGSQIKLGAQNAFWEAEGAYTGEISPLQLKEVGCQFVILGHSERRDFAGETDEIVHNKVKTALISGLVPVICVGESYEERREGSTDYALIKQVTKALEGIDVKLGQQLVVAYEPVWVIGSGRAINPEDADAAQGVIRQTLIDLFPVELVEKTFRITYGGSLDSKNVSKFANLENSEGFLIGGSSLKPEEFAGMVEAM